MPALEGARKNAKETTFKNNLRQIGLAMNQYQEDNGEFPPGNGVDELNYGVDQLKDQLKMPADMFVDPWGNKLLYRRGGNPQPPNQTFYSGSSNRIIAPPTSFDPTKSLFTFQYQLFSRGPNCDKKKADVVPIPIPDFYNGWGRMFSDPKNQDNIYQIPGVKGKMGMWMTYQELTKWLTDNPSINDRKRTE